MERSTFMVDRRGLTAAVEINLVRSLY